MMTGNLQQSRRKSIICLIVAEIAAMSLWFVSTAILPEMTDESALHPMRAAALSSAVQLGFVLGAVLIAVQGTADRYDPRRVFCVAALVAALSNLGLILLEPGSLAQIATRGLTGFCLAGVYPVGMKIAVGWSTQNRGLLVGILVGALTLGSAMPHAIALLGEAEWRITVLISSALAHLSGTLVLAVRLGPHHARAADLDPAALILAWRSRPLRLAYAGYLCHMWELYAFWAWIAAALAVSFEQAGQSAAVELARLTTFGAIALGGVLCVPAGGLADRLGKARIAGVCMVLSAAAAFGTALTFGGPPALSILFVVLWGAFIIPDSAQFSALVADAAPAERAGSLMTLQTALGFLLTVVTVQGTPVVAAYLGWPATLALLGIGPVLGVEAMRRLNALTASTALERAV